MHFFKKRSMNICYSAPHEHNQAFEKPCFTTPLNKLPMFWIVIFCGSSDFMSSRSELEICFIWWFLVLMQFIMFPNEHHESMTTEFHETNLLKKHNIYTFEITYWHLDTKHVIHVKGIIQYPFLPRNRDRVSNMDLLHSKKATCKPLQCPSFRHSLGFLPSFATQSCWRRQALKSSLSPAQARPSSSLSS